MNALLTAAQFRALISKDLRELNGRLRRMGLLRKLRRRKIRANRIQGRRTR